MFRFYRVEMGDVSANMSKYLPVPERCRVRKVFYYAKTISGSDESNYITFSVLNDSTELSSATTEDLEAGKVYEAELTSMPFCSKGDVLEIKAELTGSGTSAGSVVIIVAVEPIL